MKTADLIPFLLIELNESDKYGFELTKNIETKSNGKIIIKQPTLYTLLKKLEKSKFITSYWQDSEIGGKRHYYKITDNGKLQLSTLPSYDVLMQNLLANEEMDSENNENSSNNDATIFESQKNEDKTKEQYTNIADKTEHEMPSTPIEDVLPTEEVFSETSVDTKTVADLNQENAKIFSSEKEQKEENFVTNVVVAKFVEVKPVSTPEVKPTTKTNNDIIDLDIAVTPNKKEVKYVDYVNLKTSKEYKTSKNFSKIMIFKSILISFYIIALLVCFSLLSDRFGTSTLYYASFIVGSVVAIFYPILTSLNIDKIKSKFKQRDYKVNNKLSVILKFALICFVLLSIFVFNIAIENNSFEKIFSIYNFMNFYAPILLTTSLLIDSLLAYVLTSKIKK